MKPLPAHGSKTCVSQIISVDGLEIPLVSGPHFEDREEKAPVVQEHALWEGGQVWGR